MNGFLVVDKPAGMTSHDVVARVRRALGIKRVGHAGTLDPPATGVLLVGVGTTTRLLRFVEAHDKEYLTDAVFGVTTTTQDATGEVLQQRDAAGLDEETVRRALARFIGHLDQVPPMVSAVKVGGERLYRKALRGEEVERTARRVRVDSIEPERWESGTHPRATLRIVCSKGTYVRTLVADLGEHLGTGAHVATLRRTRIGPFGEADAVALADLGPQDLRAPDGVVAGYPRRAVGPDEVLALVHGKPLAPAGIDGPYAAVGPAGLVAMVQDVEGEARSLCVVSVP